jgi:hypothetical protein
MQTRIVAHVIVHIYSHVDVVVDCSSLAASACIVNEVVNTLASVSVVAVIDLCYVFGDVVDAVVALASVCRCGGPPYHSHRCGCNGRRCDGS